jgi:hypothetical protein
MITCVTFHTEFQISSQEESYDTSTEICIIENMLLSCMVFAVSQSSASKFHIEANRRILHAKRIKTEENIPF